MKPGEGKNESGNIRLYAGNKGWLSPSTFNNFTTTPSNTLIYIGLPHNDAPTTSDLASFEGKKVRRYVVFKPFLDSFSRVFDKEVKFYEDTAAPFFQFPMAIAKNGDVSYSFSFNVPAINLTEAKYNCAKVQYLMRMFFTRRKTKEEIPLDESLSVNVYIHSFIEKANTNKRVANNLDDAHNRAAMLKFQDLEIDIEAEAGFFREGQNLYPKVFKVSIDLLDTNKSNYIKIRADGVPEATPFDIESGDDVRGYNVGQEFPSLFPSKTKYWSPK